MEECSRRVDSARANRKESADDRQQHDGNDVTGQRREHHQRWKQVDLRAENIANEADMRFEEDRHVGERQNENGVQAAHLFLRLFL